MIRFLFMIALAMGAHSAFAVSNITLQAGQSYGVDYNVMSQAGGFVEVTCAPGGGYPPPPPPPPQRPTPNCGWFRWDYIVNQAQTSQYICTANGRMVGAMRSCTTDGDCGSAPAIQNFCQQLCYQGAFNGQL